MMFHEIGSRKYCNNDNANDVKIYSFHLFTIDKLLSMKMQKAYTKTGCKSNENSIDEIKVKCPKEVGCVLYGQSITCCTKWWH